MLKIYSMLKKRNPEILEIISSVLENFDPNKKIDEEDTTEAMFEAQFKIFDNQISHEGGHAKQRRGIEKKVKEGYFEDM